MNKKPIFNDFCNRLKNNKDSYVYFIYLQEYSNELDDNNNIIGTWLAHKFILRSWNGKDTSVHKIIQDDELFKKNGFEYKKSFTKKLDKNKFEDIFKNFSSLDNGNFKEEVNKFLETYCIS